ncbi:MAG: hypothetical protein KDA29_06470 [Phycisphaerales bacterium]|nr:hypothetical protein [Phycisphaerales bacterium]
MGDRRDIPGFDVLLCERCGYVVEGLDESGACPECGMAIEESRPRVREGSAYQTQGGLKGLVRTWGATLVRPKALFPILRIDKAAGKSLVCWGLVTAVAIPVSIFVLTLVLLIFDQYQSGYLSAASVIMPFVFLLIGALLVVCVGIAYTAFAVSRIKMVARMRGMRMNSEIAWTVAGQAAMGLTIWPLCFAVWGLVAVPVMIYAEFTGDYDVYSTRWYEVLGLIFSVILYVSFVLSFVEFEVLLSIGTRRLRYRNPVTDDWSEGFWEHRAAGPAPHSGGEMRMDIS